MQLQRTIKKDICYDGIDFYGGNKVNVYLRPSEADTGIVFRTGNGHVGANISYASASQCSILLKNGSAAAIHVEHILATLFAYGIDNAFIDLVRVPSRSFSFLNRVGLATNIEVAPVSDDREVTLCEKIEEIGVEIQSRERRLLTLDAPVYTEKLSFEPINGDGLVIKATTDYPIPGEESLEVLITPETYKSQLARSRMYAKHLKFGVHSRIASAVASLVYPSFGIGHGFTPSTVFLPARTLEEWREQENVPSEIAAHTIVDRLGALALLDGRLDGVKVTTRFSGHKNDLYVIRNFLLPNLVKRK